MKAHGIGLGNFHLMVQENLRTRHALPDPDRTMRRESDTSDGTRTGDGRRARDRLMTGDARPLPEALPPDARARAANRMLFLADELRESALAAASIESYLVMVHQLLDDEDVSPETLIALAKDDDIERRLAALDDSLSQLRRSLQVIGASTLEDSTA